MRYWFGRLAFSFLIVGCALAWEALQSAQGNQGRVDRTRVILYGMGTFACWVMGFIGIRMGHRH